MNHASQRKGILYVVNSTNMGGVMTHIIELSRYVKNYYDVYLAGPYGTWFDFVSSLGIFKKVFKGFPNIETVNEHNIALAHFHDIRSLLKVSLRDRGKPFKDMISTVATVHGLPIHRMFHMGGLYNYLAYLKRTYERIVLNKTNHIICVSEEDRKFITEYYHIEPEKLKVIYYGIDFNALESFRRIPKKDIIQQLNIDDFIKERPIIITPMRFDYQKAPEVVAQAILKVNRETNTDVIFVLIGGGKQYEQIRKLLRAETNVIFTGPLTPTDVYKWMAIADALLLASRWEGLPITLIEAGFFALPVIATNVTGTREIIHHNHTGFLVERDNVSDIVNAIKKFLSNREQFKAYGNNLRKLVLKRHRLEDMGKQVLDLYNFAIKQ